MALALNSDLRNKLERVVVEARDIVELGAKAALDALGVSNHEAFPHMSEEQRSLRTHLRARSRQIGDQKDALGNLSPAHLIQECAYEHWHRMLFARFLAENNLLIEPVNNVAISIEECKELAKEAGVDLWVLASRFAQKMLPQIFRPDDPLLQISLPREYTVKLEKLVNDLHIDTFLASDSLGWVYQFWQTKRKKQVNDSGKKIGADEISAVTQLFTEPYMVQFLIHNTIGAWWAGKYLAQNPEIATKANSEDELRKAVALPGVNWEYLRFIKRPMGVPPMAPENTGEEDVPVKGNQVQDAPMMNGKLNIRQGARLPHWTQDGAMYAITFRLEDSVAKEVLQQWNIEREHLIRKTEAEKHLLTEEDKKRIDFLFSEKVESYLDKGCGSCWMKKPEIADLIQNAILFFDRQRYIIHAWCIMPNHVHVIVQPLPGNKLSAILHSWKSFTSKEANKLLGREGAFWQVEYYDHLIRDENDYANQVTYVLNNPAKAGLTDWRWVGINSSQERYALGSHKKDYEQESGGFEDHGQDARGTVGGETRWPRGTVGGETRWPRGTVGGETRWTPAAGTFSGWPVTASQLKILDPCCGSGHFIIALFFIMVTIRQAEEGLNAKDACDAVIRDNLHGLEIDERCTQIAAFALALSAWSHPDAGGYRKLPEFHIACSGIAPSVKKSEWVALAGDYVNSLDAAQQGDLFPEQKMEIWHEPFERGMASLYELFEKAPILGSLIDPTKIEGSLFQADFTQLSGLLQDALSKEKAMVGEEAHEMAVAAWGLAKAAELLGRKYHLVITNVPYLGRGKQTPELMAFCESFHSEAKADMSTCFIERCLALCESGGSVGSVSPQNWLFQNTYTNFRKKLLQVACWNFVTKLGPNAFQDMNWWRATTQLLILSKSENSATKQLSGLDVTEDKYPWQKLTGVTYRNIARINQGKQLENPDNVIILEQREYKAFLGNYGSCIQGILPADRGQLVREFWEFDQLIAGWEFLQGSDESIAFYNGRSQVFAFDFFKNNFEEIGGRLQGLKAFGKPGISISKMRNLPVTLYSTKPFDGNAHAFILKNPNDLSALWSFFSSELFCIDVRKIDQKGDVTNSTIDKVPFDKEFWQSVAFEKYPHGLPEPYSNDPTQWIYHGDLCASVLWNDQSKKIEFGDFRIDGNVLHVAVARLLGYRWPAELDDKMRLSTEARDLVAKCDALLSFADGDGIVAIPSVRGEEPAADRVRALLAKAYGSDWTHGIELSLISATGSTAPDIDTWLRNDFFEQHCKMFHHRPFIWHFWDGRQRDGFNVLVNYHKLAEGDGKGRRLLDSLIYSYLGDWINRQKDEVKREVGGADDRLTNAMELQKRLVQIAEGEQPYDIFVRWKPINKQAIGWEPDINDGVRLNIRPFLQPFTFGKTGAGILRWKPNINWNKDRGTEPNRSKEEYPWFWDGNKFTGERVNDKHLEIEDKRKARARTVS
jgi:REP element-mobilizing transposase RayT